MAVQARSRLYRVSQLIDNDLAAYSTNDAMGSEFGVQVHNVAGRGIYLHKIRVIDAENQTANDISFHLFSASFTATADNAAFGIASLADAKNYIGKFSLAHSGYVAATIAVGDIDVSRPIYLSGTKLYFQCQADNSNDSTAASIFTAEFIYERLA